jgi:hypothetical protein
MALFFFVLVPMFVLAIALALLVFGRRSRVATGIGGTIVLLPVFGLAYWAMDELRINRGVAELQSGRGYFASEPARSLAAAIVRHDLPEVVRLIPKTDINISGRTETTFLKLALQRQEFDLPIVEALLHAGANPNEDHAWPVSIAIYFGSAPLLAAVLRAGGEPNTLDGLDIPIFFRAVQHPELISQLLEGGARIEARSFTGQTMLLYAVEERSWDAVEILLARGADRAVVDRDGRGLAGTLQAVRNEDEDNRREITPGLLRLEARLRDGR